MSEPSSGGSAARLPHGRDKEAESDDPMLLEGVALPGGDDAVMARCIVEEYVRMGAGRDALLGLFTDPLYHTHLLLLKHGEPWVRALIDETLARTGTLRFTRTEDGPACPVATGRRLPSWRQD